MARILIAGCGYVGHATARLLLRDGHSVWGLRRRSSQLAAGIEPFAADLCDPKSLANLPRVDHVFYLASAGGRDDEAYRRAYVDGLRNLLAAVEPTAPKRLFFASSTRVYPQAGGAWVDERSATSAWHFTSRRLLEGEALAAAAALPTTTVRFSGIYGPSRTSLLRRVLSGEARLWHGTPSFTNRIHRDDCAAVLAHLMDLDDPDDLYVATDSEPVDHDELLLWIAERLGVEPPAKAGAAASQPPTSGTSGRPLTNKRCSNERLLATGYRFLYPSFRDGYEELISSFSPLHTT